MHEVRAAHAVAASLRASRGRSGACASKNTRRNRASRVPVASLMASSLAAPLSAADDDAYGDLSYVFPHLDSSLSLYADDEGEDNGGEYEIRIEDTDEPPEVSAPDPAPVDADAEQRRAGEGKEVGNDDLTACQPKTFLSRSVNLAPRGCDRCLSDVNGKLMAKCACCAFRRHLYCFSPPLQQHPALQGLAHAPRHKRLPVGTLIAQWRCGSCAQRLGHPSAEFHSVKKPLPKKRRSPKKKTPNLTLSETPLTDRQPKTSQQAFDWYEFRAEKFQKVFGESTTDAREEDEETDWRKRLVCFSPSETLLRRTARFWQQHVRKRRQLRAMHAARLEKCQLPMKRALLVELTPREAAEVAESNQKHRERESEEQVALFDDARHYTFDDPRPIFETLRRKPALTISNDNSESLDVEDLERLADDERQREILEALLMAEEDDDAPTPSQAARLAARRAARAVAIVKDPSLLGLYLAARIIESSCVRWLRCIRQTLQQKEKAREEEERREMTAEDAAQRLFIRREGAQSRALTLRFVMKFLLAMVRTRRRLEVKKQLIVVLSDAAEDQAFMLDANTVVEAERRIATEKLAARRIRRFFLRRVRKYLQLKKRVMAWRIARWWKRRHLAWAFRRVATLARARRREQAARRIQRCFRAFHVYKTFKSLREKLLVKKLKGFLRGWLVRRIIRKEHDRVAVYGAALSITGGGLLLEATAPLIDIVRCLGIYLYEHSDFWNAAALLERLPEAPTDTETRLALAYSHHMVWYSSCDAFHLVRAYEVYSVLLQDQARDVFVLQEAALVLMHREEFVASLRVFALLIELYRDEDGFPLWLLLSGVMLQQVDRWAQSVEYLRYLSDLVLPPPYEERDVLALCAMSYERVDHGGGGEAREAWRAAIRLWTTEKKLASIEGRNELSYCSAVAATTTKSINRQRKWELLGDLAQRASGAGHYLVACRVLLYALERLPPGDENTTTGEKTERQRAWWLLGGAFRHLGKLELHVEATSRSQETPATAEERRQWLEHAQMQATAFSMELKSVKTCPLVERIQSQYEQQAHGNEWRLEDVDAAG